LWLMKELVGFCFFKKRSVSSPLPTSIQTIVMLETV
jgi:hypothetical protein